MKALVTGGAGFLGSALVRELVSQSNEVCVFDNFSAGTMDNLSGTNVNVVNGDILSWSFADAVKTFRPDIVYHLAAEPFIPNGYNNPQRFVNTNVAGTMNVLYSCKLFDVPRIINYSSSEVYGTATYVPMDEGHPTLPRSTYAGSKLLADRIGHIWSKEQGIPVVNVRPFNCYGPREAQPYVIPEIIRQLSEGTTLTLGNLDARRDFTYCEDHAKAVVAVAEKGEVGETYNIGTGESWSVRELANIISEIMGVSPDIKSDPSKLRPYDVDELVCDSSKLRKLTGWEPKVGIYEGLERTVRWFRKAGRWSYQR